MSEQWRTIADAPGYEVSDAGRVRSHRPLRPGADAPAEPRVLAPVFTKKGYARVHLCGRHRPIHQLVLTAFVGSRPAGMQACHANGDPKDNRLSNLRWDAATANHADKRAHGTLPVGHRNGAHTRPERRPTGQRNGNHTKPESRPRGVRNPHAKLTDEDVRAIRAERAAGAKVAELSERYGIAQSVVSAVALRRRWAHVHEPEARAKGGERE